MITTWEITGPEVLIGRHLPYKNRTTSTKVAAFDLDATLVITKSGKHTAVDPLDWDWWHPSVPPKLKQISGEGYEIVIFTNQGRLTTIEGAKSPTASLFQTKVESIFHSLDLPVTIYAACANDSWRKPRTRAWEHYVGTALSETAVDIGGSYFVGDAAGRSQDHTDADRHFSMNVGIGFYTPEKYFLGASSETWEHKFDPASYHQTAFCDYPSLELPRDTSLILLVGLPGSGKSTYFLQHLRGFGYDRLDANSNITEETAISMANDLLKAGRTVVVDGWNLDACSRGSWIAVGRAHKVALCAIHFTTNPQLCLHNDAVRALGCLQGVRAVYPRTAFWKLVKTFQPPQKAEGFDCVIEIDFTWKGSTEALSIWRKFWI